jgi:hypothetical protein
VLGLRGQYEARGDAQPSSIGQCSSIEAGGDGFCRAVSKHPDVREACG